MYANLRKTRFSRKRRHTKLPSHSLQLLKQHRQKTLRSSPEQADEENRALARFFFEYAGKDYRAVIGVDEVGRGALFGPVTIGAVLLTREQWQELPARPWFSSVTDSKLMTRLRREQVISELRATLPHATAHVAVRYIDAHNINNAIKYGIYRAVQAVLAQTGMPTSEVRIIADGNYRFEYPAVGMGRVMPRIDPEIKADLKYFPVSAASVIAKVTRDRLIARADSRFPGYGFAAHAGYGTAKHTAAIAGLGQTKFHRRSFSLKART